MNKLRAKRKWITRFNTSLELGSLKRIQVQKYQAIRTENTQSKAPHSSTAIENAPTARETFVIPLGYTATSPRNDLRSGFR